MIFHQALQGCFLWALDLVQDGVNKIGKSHNPIEFLKLQRDLR